MALNPSLRLFHISILIPKTQTQINYLVDHCPTQLLCMGCRIRKAAYPPRLFCVRSWLSTTSALCEVLVIYHVCSVWDPGYPPRLLCARSWLSTTSALCEILVVHHDCSLWDPGYPPRLLCVRSWLSTTTAWLCEILVIHHACSVWGPGCPTKLLYVGCGIGWLYNLSLADFSAMYGHYKNTGTL